MIWFTWRQFRVPAVVTAVALAALGVVLVITGRSIAHMYADVAGCQNDCGGAIDSFLAQVRGSVSGNVYDVALMAVYALPGLIGVFWGAPLVARELETGTHRLAWNQSVTRTRWLATKLALVGAATAAATGILSAAVTVWARHIDSASADRITPMVFGARGIVPIGYALFAFALGVTAGMLIRRTVPAMAATLAVYVAAAAAMPLWIRAHLVPARHDTPALDLERMNEISIHHDNTMRILGDGVAGAWTTSNQTITPSGQVFTGPADPTVCGPDGSLRACNDWLNSLGLRQDLVYHPASHFWPLQWAETGVFVAVAALLTGFCFWWIRRRVA